jgi:hypothetical protein
MRRPERRAVPNSDLVISRPIRVPTDRARDRNTPLPTTCSTADFRSSPRGAAASRISSGPFASRPRSSRSYADSRSTARAYRSYNADSVTARSRASCPSGPISDSGARSRVGEHRRRHPDPCVRQALPVPQRDPQPQGRAGEGVAGGDAQVGLGKSGRAGGHLRGGGLRHGLAVRHIHAPVPGSYRLVWIFSASHSLAMAAPGRS